MLRNSFLLEKSSKHYETLIENLASFDSAIWDVDVDRYNDANISLLLKGGEMIANSLGAKDRAWHTLATKIMLGVFGNIPAFDSYLPKGLGVGTFSAKSLRKIFEFYKANSDEIDRPAPRWHGWPCPMVAFKGIMSGETPDESGNSPLGPQISQSKSQQLPARFSCESRQRGPFKERQGGNSR